MNLNEEQISALAPDDSSRKAGKELANASKWSNTTVNEKALWGECQGSGKNPYRTQVDLTAIAFKCTCPSRKFPCKHGIGLLLLYSRQKNLFPEAESPSWVKEWIDKRDENLVKKQEKADKPVDAVAQAKRQQQRLNKVEDGIAELQLVIKDIVRNGILHMPEKGPALFANLTRRMIDSQASGLAAMMRELAEMNYYKEHWQSDFLDQLLRIYIISSAFGKQEELPVTLSDEIKSLIGFSQSTEELKQQEGMKDDWFVLGKSTSQQEQLMVQRNWLLGVNTGMYALILQFYVRAQQPEINLTPGTVVEAELVFYKGVFPFRAMLKNSGKTSFPKQIKGFPNWSSVAQYEKGKYRESPFITDLPFLINDVNLAYDSVHWYISDEENKTMKLVAEGKALYKMLAFSGGKKFSVALTGQEGSYQPIGMLTDGGYVML